MNEELYELNVSLNKLKSKGWDKYNLYLYKGEEKIGYIAFLLSEKDKSVSFRGIYVKEKFRRKGISKILFKDFRNYCNSLGIEDIHTNKQKKPLTILLLQKQGFTPINNSDHKKLNLGFEDDSIYLDFNNKKLEDKFFKSTIAKTNKYRKLEKEIKLQYEVQINSGYRLER